MSGQAYRTNKKGTPVGITLVGGTKGGSGKSTITSNLAVALASANLDVLVVDADEQRSMLDFSEHRKASYPEGPQYTCIPLSGLSVRTEVLRLSEKFDHVLIDTGGRDTASQRAALSVCDTFLIPVPPRTFDVWTIDKVASLVTQLRAEGREFRALAFINRGELEGTENAEAAEMIQGVEGIELLPSIIHNRKAYGHAVAAGRAVFEMKRDYKNKDAKPLDVKAAMEFAALFEELVKKKDFLRFKGYLDALPDLTGKQGKADPTPKANVIRQDFGSINEKKKA